MGLTASIDYQLIDPRSLGPPFAASTTRYAWASPRRAAALMGQVTTVGTPASTWTHLRDSVAVGDVAVSAAAALGLLDSWHTV